MEEHMVVVSILLAWHEEEVVDRVMEESFENLRDDQLHAWLGAKKIGKNSCCTMAIPQHPSDDLA
jgi:hypothetical protein